MSRSGDRKSIRVGAAQFDAVAGDIAANIAAHERLIDDAGSRGVEVLVFPELSLTGYASPLDDAGSARHVIDPGGPDLGPIEDACRRNRVVAVVGASINTTAGLGLAAFVVDRRGRVCATYVKQHLDGHEKDWFVPGTTRCLIEVDGGGWRSASATTQAFRNTAADWRSKVPTPIWCRARSRSAILITGDRSIFRLAPWKTPSTSPSRTSLAAMTGGNTAGEAPSMAQTAACSPRPAPIDPAWRWPSSTPSTYGRSANRCPCSPTAARTPRQSKRAGLSSDRSPRR